MQQRCRSSSACASMTCSSASASGAPKQGGTLTLSYLSEPSSLDPAIAWNVIDWQIEHDIYQGFLQYEHKAGAAGTKLIPCLATEVPSTANGGISAVSRPPCNARYAGLRPMSTEVLIYSRP